MFKLTKMSIFLYFMLSTAVIMSGCYDYSQTPSISTKITKVTMESENLIIQRSILAFQQQLGLRCMWCFSYSKSRTLDCLRRETFGRYFYLLDYHCMPIS